MKTKIAVIIGRWQIYHKGHNSLLKTALKTAPNVIIVIGSAWRSRDSRNPFTWQERQEMIEATLTPAERARVSFLPVRDYYDNQRWNAAIRAGVDRLTTHGDPIALVGHKKDLTSHYLDDFSGWLPIAVMPELTVSATELRAVYFGAQDPLARVAAMTVLARYVHPGVLAYLAAWAHLSVYAQCAKEHQTVVAYREKYTAPFYLTADAVVTANRHLLLVQRGSEKDVGRGLWALPGGFVEPGETFYDAAVRELGEETGLRPLPSTLKACLKADAIFDHPMRSPRGRLVTRAFHFDFGNVACPEVYGSVDAGEVLEVRWVPFEELPLYEDRLFEDHNCISDRFVGLFPKI